MAYDISHFIEKFNKTSNTQWRTREFTDEQGRCCALGHCGERDRNIPTPEATALSAIFSKNDESVISVNDYASDTYPQEFPRDRVLAALYKFKAEELD